MGVTVSSGILRSNCVALTLHIIEEYLMLNTKARNTTAALSIQRIAKWHEGHNLVQGSTTDEQLNNLLEAVLKVYMSLLPETKPEEGVRDIISRLTTLFEQNKVHTAKVLPEAFGDVMSVLINMAERDGSTVAEALMTSFKRVEHQKPNLVKTEPLPIPKPVKRTRAKTTK